MLRRRKVASVRVVGVLMMDVIENRLEQIDLRVRQPICQRSKVHLSAKEATFDFFKMIWFMKNQIAWIDQINDVSNQLSSMPDDKEQMHALIITRFTTGSE